MMRMEIQYGIAPATWMNWKKFSMEKLMPKKTQKKDAAYGALCKLLDFYPEFSEDNTDDSYNYDLDLDDTEEDD